MANANFIFYDSRNAEAITSTGQVAIKFIERKFNEYFHKLLGTDTDVVLAVDTDSVVGDTEIFVNNKKIEIQKFYDSTIQDEETTSSGGKIKNLKKHNFFTMSFDGECIIEKPIDYIFKHEVEKEFFEISVGNKKVTITEDHSLMVFRDGKIKEVSPKNILGDDEIIFIE